MKFQIKQAGIIHYIDIEEIISCRAERAYCTVFLLNKEKITCSKPLSEISKVLSQPYFVRIHDSFLINLHFVKKQISSNCKLYVLMSNGEKLPVGRRKKSVFQQAMNKFLS
ncbi:MAG: LytTR family transcriptional regulator, partial [Mariniphaga sp.]|nr:LytTR family transcriptional regulator [Mariniphaga sp.]